MPGTRIEAELIARILGVEPWIGQQALKGRVKRSASPAVLLLATHGFYCPYQSTEMTPSKRESLKEHLSALEDPLLRSGLALAGANHALKPRDRQAPDAEDGLLTAADVAEMDLLDTELVVLSACQTGLGDVEIGQGVSGLRTAFQVAGAKSLVMTLWPVDDLATCIFMKRFFDNLFQRRLPRDEALDDAKNHLRQLTIGQMRSDWLTATMRERFVSARPDFTEMFDSLEGQTDSIQPYIEPYFWAPFVLIGETDPLPIDTLASVGH